LSEFRSHGRKHSNDRLRTIRHLSTKVGESVTTEGGGNSHGQRCRGTEKVCTTKD
jgi:hypothetical protein